VGKLAEVQPAKPAVETAAAGQAAGSAPIPSACLQGKAAPVSPTASAGINSRNLTVSTDLLKATISTQGGDLVSLELLKYKEHDDKAARTSSCSMPSTNTWPRPA
jgi:YidC/Oxa1 family membrane protein insertase